MPLRLAGISARYSVPCSIQDDGPEAIEHLSIVECLDPEPAAEGHFGACMDSVMSTFPARPLIQHVAGAVERLVAIFQALSAPPQREVTGAIGELCVILAAADPAAAVRAWHMDPMERYDFAVDGLRLDVKATKSAERIHSLTADQACPPAGVIGLLASVMVRQASGGVSLRQLVDRIVGRFRNDGEATLRLHQGLARILGSSMLAAMEHRFDLEAAVESLAFFDLSEVPAVRPPFPPGVSDVRFRVDLQDLEQLDLMAARGALPKDSASLLPSS